LSIPNRFNLIIGLVDPAPSSSRLVYKAISGDEGSKWLAGDTLVRFNTVTIRKGSF